jgi:hypothetical protein
MTDMQHLSGDALVDLLEGLVSNAGGDTIAHLASCDRCRDQLAGLRAARAMASEVEVPEPSALFWDHFSARVREAVANESPPPDGWWRRVWSWPGVLAPASAVAALIAVLAVVLRAPAPTTSAPATVTPSHSVAGQAPAYSVELLGDSVTADDDSLAVVAGLTDSIGLDAAADAGLASDGSAEHAVTHMSAAELQQLERLLTEAMSHKGA